MTYKLSKPKPNSVENPPLPYSSDDLTQLCARCGLNVFLDLEDHYFQGGLGDYSNNPHNLHANAYMHVYCKNRSRPNRPNAIPRQKQ